MRENAFTATGELLESDMVDAVSICTTAPTHRGKTLVSLSLYNAKRNNCF
jgi:predicted dehydrogenase